MNEQVALTIFSSGLWTVLAMCTPVLLTALVVGVVIAVFQSLTQIQEMTLTFVPKILMVFLALMLFFPWMMQKAVTLTESIITNIPEYISE